jgi:hypothetical protein
MHLSPATAEQVEDVSASLSTSCLDRPGLIRLSATIQRLPAPLVAAQEALVKAEYTATALSRRHMTGAVPTAILDAAKARVQTLETINYAIERGDPTALGIGLGTGAKIAGQIQALLRKAGPRACG